MESAGFIEVEMFSEDVNSLDHPDVKSFKRVLLEVAEEYDCFLVTFEINHGTVTFSFDSDELTAEILTILKNGNRG
ncbi:conserved hypothetical protein [uncultured Desulfobacterium sp.]|uniref:Uncharacterized protein n=1 Tax=uncultured Desulfobacterium sp. TaxID=201089 RepID=A0A445MVR3_9BACT|nr:conserved hypothetical protein [uncultured Desulfobacterium sp.]